MVHSDNIYNASMRVCEYAFACEFYAHANIMRDDTNNHNVDIMTLTVVTLIIYNVGTWRWHLQGGFLDIIIKSLYDD